MARQLAMISARSCSSGAWPGCRQTMAPVGAQIRSIASAVAVAEGAVEGAVGGEHGLALLVVEFRQERRQAGSGGAAFVPRNSPGCAA